MKNLIKIVFVIVFIANAAFSQDPFQPKLEFGINAFNNTAVTVPVVNYAEQDFYSNYLNGLILKLRIDKHALRFSADFANYYKCELL